MPSSPEPDLDPFALAAQIIDLHAEVDRAVRAGRYEHAAQLRDQREAMMHHLSQSGNATVAGNVRRLLRPGGMRTPVLSLLEQEESSVDADLLQVIRIAPLPPRWILGGYSGSCRASVAELLKVDALDSVYFGAQLPVFSPTTFSKTTKPMDRLAAAIREAARETSPVVWIVREPAYLAERGILDVILQVLNAPSTHFVVCLGAADAPFSASFTGIPDVTAVWA